MPPLPRPVVARSRRYRQSDRMTASELQDLLISSLIKRVGGTRRRWRIVIGPVKVYDRATHPHCNWSVSPSGDSPEISAVEDLLDEFRTRYSIVSPD